MRLFYIVPKLNNEGGVARVLSLKLNYLVKNLGYEVHVLTQNQGNYPLFYSFHEKIVFHDMILEGTVFNFFNSFRKSLKSKIESIQPDVIIVCDNGLKAYTIPFVLSDKIPVVFECHGSKYIEEKQLKLDFISKIKSSLKYRFKDFGASKFSKLVALSDESLKEWNVENGLVISNPSWIQNIIVNDLKSKKVIAVARNSYEKGLDRLLVIWQKVVAKHPDWILDIYGESVTYLKEVILELGMESNVNLNEPIKNISEKYLTSSVYVMTSRSEGFPMVLLEAMASGLPCVAYDCPTGPRAIIDDGENGFLIEDGNVDLFVQKLELLIEDENLRMKMGINAQESGKKYDLESIMQQWKLLFESLVCK
ncbi:glycosyltransferase involved in cell wall biosynthesis [Flavobacterium sp. 103]|uniref:glycosyltransferase family 4 protein n=1 Tax=Flavobacterium sp. 103 TaxID=2135624 RepID=UPI000D5D109D|nr:glycosyltransferase family 4 protein [Flavobacterium sp. 103]PVX44958.1 glycosyltransferase involved in cell wall biosynthesis [Flavobacterium sp. 103]